MDFLPFNGTQIRIIHIPLRFYNEVQLPFPVDIEQDCPVRIIGAERCADLEPRRKFGFREFFYYLPPTVDFFAYFTRSTGREPHKKLDLGQLTFCGTVIAKFDAKYKLKVAQEYLVRHKSHEILSL